jgi:TrmH family RNA methyltransferase
MTPASENPASLAHIRIVLVETAQPRNLGAAARAMKTMGITALHLVRPKLFPHPQALALAVSAADVLTAAEVHLHLHDAIGDCQAVYGLSARQRHVPVPAGAPRELAPQIIAHALQAPVAIVFGAEEAGLSNADLDLCGSLVQIPSNPQCRSLNLAAAVQLMCYELRLAALTPAPNAPLPRSVAPAIEFEKLISSLEKTLDANPYFCEKSADTMAQFRRLFKRAEPNHAEIGLLHALVRQIR